MDELRSLHSALGSMRTGNLKPGRLNQPSLFTYFITVIICGYYLDDHSFGHIRSTGELFRPLYSFDGWVELPVDVSWMEVGPGIYQLAGSYVHNPNRDILIYGPVQ